MLSRLVAKFDLRAGYFASLKLGFSAMDRTIFTGLLNPKRLIAVS